MDFLWDDSSCLVSRFWLVKYLSFVINFQISKISLELLTLDRLHPQRKSSLTLVYWHFVIVCRAVQFFYDHLLASSDLHLLAPFPEERAR